MAANMEHFVPDNMVKRCEGCSKGFGLFHPKKHCHFCGHVFCKKCVAEKMDLPEEMGFAGPQPVCQKCIPVIRGAYRVCALFFAALLPPPCTFSSLAASSALAFVRALIACLALFRFSSLIGGWP